MSRFSKEGAKISPGIQKVSGPEVFNFFSCPTYLSMKFILLIKVKMPTIVGILTFIRRINITSEGLKAIIVYHQPFKVYAQFKFHSQLG